MSSPDSLTPAHDRTEDGGVPNEEERHTLRLVSDKIPVASLLIAVVEFAERASYYGTSGPFSNFIQRPLPKGGNGAGATPVGTQLTPGALGRGLVAATALTTLFSFLSYTVPLLGGILGDTKWGRFRTIVYGTILAFISHIVLIIAAVPSVIAGGNAFAPFIIGLLLLAFGTGFIKSSVAPLMADQVESKVQKIKTLPSGERVIVDPATTVSSIMLLYYCLVNVGAFLKLGTTFAEKRIGFWAAWTIPTGIFMLMPIFLFLSYKRLVRVPPQGSVLLDTVRVGRLAIQQSGLAGARRGGDEFWDSAKPSTVAVTGTKKESSKSWLTWDDAFVDEIRRTFSACKIFLFLPIFYLADGGLGSITNSQGASMTTNGAPNDLLGSWNPLTIIVMSPLLNYVIYPYLRKKKIPFGPVARIVTGFGCGVLTMVVGAILQWQVYKTSPCGYYATNCDIGTTVSPILIWAQLPLYSLPALGELLVSVTCFEVAYLRAPQRMKGLVYAIVLFTSALSSALILIVSPSFSDPNLIWPFVGIAVANFLAAIAIWYFFRHLDDADDAAILAIGADRPIAQSERTESTVDSEEKGADYEVSRKIVD